jgi:hypothetical protein
MTDRNLVSLAFWALKINYMFMCLLAGRGNRAVW